VYSILLHEYPHALGHVEEPEVRRAVYDISLATFGPDHPATKIASEGPGAIFPSIVIEEMPSDTPDIKMVPDLEGFSHRYIS
jgi:hypothetical protein